MALQAYTGRSGKHYGPSCICETKLFKILAAPEIFGLFYNGSLPKSHTIQAFKLILMHPRQMIQTLQASPDMLHIPRAIVSDAAQLQVLDESVLQFLHIRANRFQ